MSIITDTQLAALAEKAGASLESGSWMIGQGSERRPFDPENDMSCSAYLMSAFGFTMHSEGQSARVNDGEPVPFNGDPLKAGCTAVVRAAIAELGV